MIKPFAVLMLVSFSFFAKAQTQPTVPLTQPFGKIDKADLEMKACDFEKDANAEVLFDVGNMLNDIGFVRHVRIKIFNDFGKQAANIRLDALNNNNGAPDITGVEGETINLENGQIVITPLDKKQVFTEKTDRLRSVVAFALPNVKPGSIIEFRYRSTFNGVWYFQSNFPTRYSEIQTDFPSAIGADFKFIPHVKQPYVKDVGANTDFKQIKALANVPSLPEEPYMGDRRNNLQRVEFLGIIGAYSTWPKIGELVQGYFKRDQNTDVYIPGEKEIIAKAKGLKTDDEKVAFIFNQVKSNIKWNGITTPFATNGAPKVWSTKTGNSSEINWIVYHLLKKSGIKVLPVIIGDKRFDKINPFLPDLWALASMVVYTPIDSAKSYLLDATNKFNLFNVVPKDLLNTYGLRIFEGEDNSNVFFIENIAPAIKTAYLNAEISPRGKINGTEEITSYSYNKIADMQQYTTDGEQKYLNYLKNNDNNIKISSIKLENMETDSLPLLQKINFDVDLAGYDENYIYLKANIFNLVGKNPFIKEERICDVDFSCLESYSFSNIYKLPAGYKTEALPATITIVLPDQSIFFKRIVVEDNGTLLIKYSFNRKKALYAKDDYPDIRGFYKKMYELLDEQIVLKKI